MTNGDYIRNMKDIELAEILELCKFCSLNNDDNCDGKCYQHIIEWLGQERKEKTENGRY